MFSSNLTLKATIQAEKDKEREDNRLAARYVKIRALLDEAERAINSANIARSLRNQLISKMLKARKALDTGLNIEEVIEMMTLIVSMINHEIKADKRAIEQTTSEMRHNLDMFYKYDYKNFIRKEEEKMTEFLQSKASLHTIPSRGRSRSKYHSETRRRASSAGEQVVDQGESAAKPEFPELVQCSSRTFRRTPISSVREEDSKSSLQYGDPGEDEQDASGAGETSDSKHDITCAGIDSLKEDVVEEEDPAVEHSLDTLTVCLSILQDIPTLLVSQSQYEHLVTTMRLTKELLMTLHGCTALSGPMNMLRTAIDAGSKNVPKQDLLNQALAEMNSVVSTFDYHELETRKSTGD